jgi:hypothetical protein
MNNTKNKTIEIQNIQSAIESEIEMLETLQDDLSEFAKGCTDTEQEKISPTLHIIMDRITLESKKLNNLK